MSPNLNKATLVIEEGISSENENIKPASGSYAQDTIGF